MRFLFGLALLTTAAMANEPTLPDQVFSVKKEELALLPNGNHAASILEFMFQPAVLVNTDTAGFSRSENVQVSMLGESTRWQRWFFAGANISNPLKPGEPLLYMPLALTGEIRADKYATLSTAKNGIHLNPIAIKSAERNFTLGAPFEIAGPTFVPRATADREPASDWGAPTSARGFSGLSGEGNAMHVFSRDGQPMGYLLADGYVHRRTFLNLSSPETAGEFTLSSAFSPGYVAGDTLRFTTQGRTRSNLGIEYFLPESQTLKSNQFSSLVNYDFKSEKAEGSLALGYAYRQTSLNSAELTRSLTESLIQPPVNLFTPEKSHSGFFDVSGMKRISGDVANLEYGIQSRLEFMRRAESAPSGRLTESLYTVPYAATVYPSDSAEANFLLRWQPFLRAVKRENRYEYQASTNAHIDWGFTNAGTKIAFIHPAGELKGKTYIGQSAVFVGGAVLHDTLGFTLQEVSFLNADALSAIRYNWADTNANRTAETSELTQGRGTGGKYHSSATRLDAPAKEEINFLVGYTGFKNWILQVNFNGRMYRKLFEVRTDSNGLYELRNAEKEAYYAHVEISLMQTPSLAPWIFRASVGGYYGAGYAPQGLNAFYNDAGAYNESTVDPIFRENRFGRLDNDRGYMGKILFGRTFAKVFTASNVIRYRDGEPMAGYRIATGLPQGPIAIPTEERGGGVTGVGRHTYSFAWDLRLRYDTLVSGNKAWAFVDIFNLINSRTELAEIPLTGTAFRDPVEQGIARTLRLGFGMNF